MGVIRTFARPYWLAGLILALAGVACALGAPPIPETPSPQPTPTPSFILNLTPPPAATAAPTPTPAGTELPIGAGPWLVAAGADGDRLVVAGADGGQAEIPIRPLLDSSDLARGAAPAGGWLAFRTRDLELALLHLPDGRLETLTPLVSEAVRSAGPDEFMLAALRRPDGLSWSPDGRYLAFTAAIDGPSSDLYLYDAREGRIRRLTVGLRQAIAPLWSPDGLWVILQELVDRGQGGQVTRVLAAAIDHAEVRKLYVPPAGGLGEAVIGWADPGEMLTFTRTPLGGEELRLAPVSARYLRRIDAGPFRAAALDPRTGAVALIQDEQTAPHSRLAPGLYQLGASGGAPSTVRAGEWNRVAWSAVDGRFYAGGASGVLAFKPGGDAVLLKGEADAAPASDGQWLIGWGGDGGGDPGLRLYTPSGGLLQAVTRDPVRRAIWRPDARGFFFLAGEGLYRADFPQALPVEVAAGVAGDLAWVGR